MSRRLDISSLLCNDESTSEAVAPQLRHSNAHESQRSPSPSFATSSGPVSASSPHQSTYAQRPLSASYSTSRNPPIATSHSFNPLHALVHAATEERRRLSGGSPGTSPLDSSTHSYSRQYPQSTTQLPRSNQSPIQHYSHSPTQQSVPFRGRSPVSSPTHAVQSPPLSVRSPISSQQYIQDQQRYPGRPHPPFERTPSVPSPTLDTSYHPYYQNPSSTETYFIQRQQVEREHRNYELLGQRQHQERTYREELPHSSGRIETYHTTSPSTSPLSSHRPYGSVSHESISYHAPPPIGHHTDRPPERDRSSIHDLCLPTKPSPPPSLPQPLPSSPPSSNKRRYSDTHGPSPYQHQTLIPSTSRDINAGEVPAPPPATIPSPRTDSTPGHVERKYLGLADMMSPVEDHRTSVSRETHRTDHAPAVPIVGVPPRKRTPPGSSEGRAKALKSMGDFSRTPFAAPIMQASTSRKGDEDRQQDRLYSRTYEENARNHEQMRKPELSLPSGSLELDSPKALGPHSRPAETSTGVISPKTHRSQGDAIAVEETVSQKAQKGLQDIPAAIPSQRPRSKQERMPGSQGKKTESPPIHKPALSENPNHQRRHPSPPKMQKLLSSGGIPANRSPPPKGKNNDDAHEWFLEQFDDAPMRPPSRPPSSKAHDSATGKKPSSKIRSGSCEKPPHSPANDTLRIDQELEALVSDTPIVTKTEPSNDYDMDVDLAVDQLVAEALNDTEAKEEENTMEVDVDNELLSLVEEPSAQEDKSNSRHTRVSVEDTTTATPLPSTQLSIKPVHEKSITDRNSMPPPSALPQSKDPKEAAEKEEKQTEREATQTPPLPQKKKKEVTKGSQKAKVASSTTAAPAAPPIAKARSKPGTKAKSKVPDSGLAVPAATPKAKTPVSATKKVAASRSRSASVKPGGETTEVSPQQEEEPPEEAPEQDKLYCVCKTKYDEDKFMIACDKCDEWYHTQCVQMPDLEVDLVDQFICPPCIEKHPDLNLRTTYKPRCLFGLIQEDPDSPDACHRPARGSYSKYCSDECGVSYMQLRLTAWTRKGGKKDTLWQSVQAAQPREGVVVSAPDAKVIKDSKPSHESGRGVAAARIARDLERLNELLDSVVGLREEIKKGLDVVGWREKLMICAADRAEQVGECGWDQRLCFGDAEWADFGSGVFETYDEVDKDEVLPEGFGAWWCPGKAACDRHSGWQTLRYREIGLEKEQMEIALHNLTTREREIRKRIEDLLAPQNRKTAATASPMKSSGSKNNGVVKVHGNSGVKRTKKRKAPS